MHSSPNQYDMESMPRVRVWLELGSSDGSGTVEVGQMTTLNVRALLPGSVGVRIVDCTALDGLGEASQKLLDDRGCPIDEQVRTPEHFSISIQITNQNFCTREIKAHFTFIKRNHFICS